MSVWFTDEKRTLTKQLPGAKLKGKMGESLNLSCHSSLNTYIHSIIWPLVVKLSLSLERKGSVLSLILYQNCIQIPLTAYSHQFCWLWTQQANVKEIFNPNSRKLTSWYKEMFSFTVSFSLAVTDKFPHGNMRTENKYSI